MKNKGQEGPSEGICCQEAGGQAFSQRLLQDVKYLYFIIYLNIYYNYTIIVMEKIAIKNLCLLQNSNDFLGNQFKLTGVQFETQKEDTYDQVYTPNQLEYPVYFHVSRSNVSYTKVISF